MNRLLLVLLTSLALADPAHAQFWDLFRTGKFEEVKALIIKHPELINAHDSSMVATPLHLAARFASPEMVLFLIDKGANVNALETNKFTPLHEVTTAEKAKLLIEHGANTNLKDAWGNTPLQKATEEAYLHPPSQGCPGVALCIGMLEAGAKLDILSALYLGKRDEVIKMVIAEPVLVHEHPNDINLWHNVTPLGIAASLGDKELVELFLKNGAPVDGTTKTPMGITMTPLTNALANDHLEVAEILLQAGASLDAISLDWVKTLPDPKTKELIQRYATLRAKNK